MKIVDEKALALFRGPGRCELCGGWASERDAHHFWYKRGLGGGSRLDVVLNLVSLDRLCHNMAESGPAVQAIKQRLLEIVARREGRSEAEIVAELTALKWGKKK